MTQRQRLLTLVLGWIAVSLFIVLLFIRAVALDDSGEVLRTVALWLGTGGLLMMIAALTGGQTR